MDDLGLEDGDDALQYALMLSMDEGAQNGDHQDSSVTGAFDANRSSDADVDDAELQEMLEMIRLAEERERQTSS